MKTIQPFSDDEDLESKLADLGLTRENFRILMLLPSIYVAWSDGEITQEESDLILEIAAAHGLATEEERERLREWLFRRPSPAFFEEGLHLLSLILAVIPEELGRETPNDATALAEMVAHASGGLFGLLFTVSLQERIALQKIEEVLRVTGGRNWQPLLERLREDWRVTDWKVIEEPQDTSAYDSSNPFLFTSPKAIDDYRAGLFTKADDSLCTLDELERDLRTDVMRIQDWTETDLQFRAILDQLIEQELIEDMGIYWNNSPHAVVYRVKENTKIYLAGKEFRLHQNEQLVFQCPMARDLYKLDGPFMAGHFVPTTDSMLCSDMANAMMGMRDIAQIDMKQGGMGDAGTMSMQATSMDTMGGAQAGPPPDVELAKVQVDASRKVVYFLVDVSGSMRGHPVKQAQAALLSFLQTIPTGSTIRVAIRTFASQVDPLRGSLQETYNPAMKSLLITSVQQLETGGSTALYQCVAKALDDIQRNVQNNQAPKTYLIVLSDGEDNRGIREHHYGGMSGENSLFQRVQGFRDSGLLEYLPIAYGGTVESLDRIGGAGFHAEATDPSEIVEKFAQIRKHVMVGMPMQMGR